MSFESVHRVTVIYTGVNDPQVHIRGCTDIARAMKVPGTSREDMDARGPVDIARVVYSDVIAEGEDPQDLAAALDIKPCAAFLDSKRR